MRVVNLEEILRYIESQNRSVEFDELLEHFGVETRNDRTHFRSKVCTLVRQRWLVKTGENSWRATT